jgi:serine/threonine-protein kinase RsbW
MPKGGVDLTPPDFAISLTSDLQSVRFALRDVRRRIENRQDFAATADTAEIVLGEALNNVVEHAYQFDDGHPIELSVTFGNGALKVRVEDIGVAMPDGTLPRGDMPALSMDDRSALPEGGFGWAMIHELTTDLAYRRDKCRNHLSFSIPASTTT